MRGKIPTMTLLCFCAICPTASPSCTGWPTSALPFSTKPAHSFTQWPIRPVSTTILAAADVRDPRRGHRPVKEQTGAFLEKSRDLLERADTMMGVGLTDDAGRAAYLAGLHAAQAFIF